MQKREKEEVKYPVHWTPMDPEETYKTVELKIDDPDENMRAEYEWVSRSFLRDSGEKQP